MQSRKHSSLPQAAGKNEEAGLTLTAKARKGMKPGWPGSGSWCPAHPCVWFHCCTAELKIDFFFQFPFY